MAGDGDEEDLCEVQENEVEALKSIFGSDCQDLRDDDVWKKPRPPELLLRLLPENNTQGHIQSHVSVSLHILAGHAYPRQQPTLSLREPKGLSETKQLELLAKLRQLAASLEGGEMIYELAIEVGIFLAKHNNRGFDSMAEEMEVRRRQEEEKREEGILLMEEIRRKELAKSVEERRREIAEEQAQLKKEEELALSRMRTISEGAEERRKRTSSVSTENIPSVEVSLNVSGQQLTVLKGAPMGTNSLGQVTHTAFCPSTSRLLALSQWKILKCPEGLQAAMEQELAGLNRLTFHPNIVPCIGVGFQQDGDGAAAEVSVAHELVRAPSLSALFLSQGSSPSFDLLRSICQGVLEALAHLHSSDMVHRDLRDSSVFLEPGGRVRLADAGLDWRLREAFMESSTETLKERLPAAPGRRGKKADVWRLGAIAISLIQGALVKDQQLKIPSSLPQDLQDFLSHCIDRDERSRWSAGALLEHSWLKESLSHRSLPRPRSPSPPPPPPPLITGPSSQGQSRLEQEFKIQFWIGKGAFGDVCKVQNILDDQEYAIKRIRLNPADKATTKKIMREVKLLSRLNHENVVRYYNSWRELTTTSADDMTETETSSGRTPTSAAQKSKTTSLKGFGPRSFLPPATPEEVSVDWSLSWLPQESTSDNDSSSDESEDDDDGPIVKMEESSGNVVFGSKSNVQGQKSELWEDEEAGTTESESASSAGPRVKQLHYMYIQMEYCDKQTLRSCIDTQKLHQDMVKVWRMFREIVEGLVHIHTQGIIHRDLKPVNIFIDSCDHVKIGDFGLATSGLLGREEDHLAPKSSGQPGDELTGQIGTALYVAPELLGSRITSYNQKVDLYSLGIIFFEMCSPPLATGMERGKLLGKLRSPTIELPSTWDDDNLPQQTYILRWLLSHQPSDRPTSQELAQSDWLPPPQVEEHQMQQLVRNTMKNPRAPAYRRLMDACLTQCVPHAKDVYYDSDLARPSDILTAATEEVVRKALSIFSTHGAVRVEASMLLPRTENSVHAKDSKAVTMMTRGGDTVTLPFDLRVGYARKVARLGIESQRRYCINKVLREEKVFGLHPKEGTECAFDIVGPSNSAARALADAEVLLVTSEVVLALNCWQDARLYFRLSHSALASGCFEQQAGVTSEQIHQVRELLRNCPKGQVVSRLAALGLPDQAVTSLVPLLEAELPLEQLSGLLRVVTRRPGEAAEKVKAALGELRKIETAVKSFGVPLDVLYCIRPAPPQYSGLLIQLVREKVGKGGTRRWDELAAGGRYDQLVAKFADNFRLASSSEYESPGATGVSISVDKLATTVSKSEAWQPSICQVVVGGDQEEACKLTKELWNAGVASRLEQTTRSDVLIEYGKEIAASMVVVCTSGGGGLIAQADRSWQERKVASSGGSGLARWGLAVMENKLVCLLDRTGDTLKEKEERVTLHKGDTVGNPVVNYNFSFLDRERYSQSKKKLEVRKSEKLAAALARFDPSTAVEVIAIGLPDSTLRSMANTLELDDEERMARSLEDLCGQYPRHRKDLRAIAEEMLRVRLGPKAPVIVLYSLEETHRFRIMC